MEYQFKYNERPHFDHEELQGVEDIPSAKAVRDTAVEERDGKIIKSRRQRVLTRKDNKKPILRIKEAPANTNSLRVPS